jgi:hypothetical protein
MFSEFFAERIPILNFVHINISQRMAGRAQANAYSNLLKV